MFSKKTLLILTLLLILLSGCNQENEIKDYPYNGELEGENIEIYYSIVYPLTGAGEALNFYNDGTVKITTFERMIDPNPKTSETKIDREKLENLAFQIQQLGFLELEDSYDCTEKCLTDRADKEFKVTIGNKSKTIKESGDYGPKELNHIENLIKNYNQ